MLKQYGFSLIEVLASLLLISGLALFLLDRQLFNRTLFAHLKNTQCIKVSLITKKEQALSEYRALIK